MSTTNQETLPKSQGEYRPADGSKFDDREMIVLSATILILVAKEGDDSDVKMACQCLAEGCVYHAALAGRYFEKAKAICFPVSNNERSVAPASGA